MHARFAFQLRRSVAVLPAALVVGSLMACGEPTRLPPGADLGAHPTLTQPRSSLIPTVNIAPAKGWPDGLMPTPMAGMQVSPLAIDLAHPRWVYSLPNGDVLVAESNAPPKPDDGQGIKGMVMQWVMGRAGAGVPSANRITLLREAAVNGGSGFRTVFLQNLNSPFGMTLIGNDLYVATTDAVLRFPYETGQTSISAPGVKVVDLPAGRINHHWTKNLIASADGSKLYVTVGSNSNVGERGMEAETGRAAIWEVDPKTGSHRIFASGLRNPNGMGWAPEGGALWTVVNERDEIGSDLVPDYLTSVKDGAFYGWPYSYYGQNVDARVKPQRPELVAQALAPDFALGAHVAALGMAFAAGGAMSALGNGAFVGEHGSWNRVPHSGYKVVFVPFAKGQPAGLPVDVLTGFLSAEGHAYGRPVGVAVDKRGALLVADDVGNVVWRVSPAAAPK